MGIDDTIRALNNELEIKEGRNSKDVNSGKLLGIERFRKRLRYKINECREEFFHALELNISYCIKNRSAGRDFHLSLDDSFYYDNGYGNFVLGDFQKSIENIEKYLENSNDENIYEILGESYSLLGRYDEATQVLSKIVNANPENKEAYFQRAISYFEKGNLDLALKDYISSSTELQQIDSSSFSTLEFSGGIIMGISSGVGDTIENFVPSMLCSLRGLSNGIWAFAIHPNEVSKDLLDCSSRVVNFLRDQSIAETLEVVIPEIKELRTDWKHLTDFRKGEIFGTIVGKYGIDFLLLAGTGKGVKILGDLRKANAALTFDTMRSMEKMNSIKKVSSEWNTKAAEKLELIKQGKLRQDVELYRAYRDFKLSEGQVRKILHEAGYRTFPKPSKISSTWEAKITNKNGGMKYVHPRNKQEFVRVMPGDPKSPNPVQRKPYVVHHQDGKAITKNGKKVELNSLEAHIPLEEYGL